MSAIPLCTYTHVNKHNSVRHNRCVHYMYRSETDHFQVFYSFRYFQGHSRERRRFAVLEEVRLPVTTETIYFMQRLLIVFQFYAYWVTIFGPSKGNMRVTS